MTFDDYKVVLYRQDDGSWVAEIPALGGCYALMESREAALVELEKVFALIAQEHQDRGIALPKDTTEIVHA
jgi:predicted RNase H-like HicB family nuclease